MPVFLPEPICERKVPMAKIGPNRRHFRLLEHESLFHCPLKRSQEPFVAG